MKKIWLLLGAALAVISACMIYLVYSGVVLRSAPLIKPSIINADMGNVGADVVLRLYPELLEAHYVILGLMPMTDETNQLLRQLQVEAEKTFGAPVQMLMGGDELSRDVLATCAKPCWVIRDQKAANELRPNPFIQEKVVTLGRDYITLSVMPFTRNQSVSDECNKEKRLDFECLGPVAVREVQRKLKDPSSRYFFLRKYNDRDHFLFLEQAAGY